MITEEDKERLVREDAKRKIVAYEEAIAKAEKYERLKDNPDWKAFLNDLKILADLHETQIRWGMSMIVDAPNDGYIKIKEGKQEYVSSRQDWIDFITRHNIQKEECLKWENEPGYIMQMAAMARERLPGMKEKAADLKNVSGQPSENGKS